VFAIIIQINGLMAQYATLEEMEAIVSMETNELRLLLVDSDTCALYEDHKVFINLRNLEGKSC